MINLMASFPPTSLELIKMKPKRNWSDYNKNWIVILFYKDNIIEENTKEQKCMPRGKGPHGPKKFRKHKRRR
jgi:hypothetical protein